MALSVVGEERGRNNTGSVTVQGDSPAEVLNRESRELALARAAQMGVSRPGISGNSGSYPVDESGEAGDPVALANSPTGCKYRVDWKIQGGL